MAESAYSRVISNWNKASTCKLSVTMTCDLLLGQSWASSEQFFLINFTHKPSGNLHYDFQALSNDAEY